jgi:hypothetical protein
MQEGTHLCGIHRHDATDPLTVHAIPLATTRSVPTLRYQMALAHKVDGAR